MASASLAVSESSGGSCYAIASEDGVGAFAELAVWSPYADAGSFLGSVDLESLVFLDGTESDIESRSRIERGASKGGGSANS